MSNLSRLLKESWTLVEEHQDRVAGYFYARVFLSHPQVRDLFPVQMDVQRARLLGAIVTAVQTLDDPERFDEYLRSLGRDHRKFHVNPEHYDVVGAALIESLRTFAGEHWSIEYDQAWRDAYAVIARKMMAGAEEYQPRLWRVYSMANAPRKDGTMEFHVRALGAGWVSSALVRRLKVGDMIKLAAPMGAMTLERKSTRDIVCVAGGTGLAPVKALVEELTRYNRTRWVHLFFGAKQRDDLYDLAELNRLAARYPWLSVVSATSEDSGYAGEQGNISDVVGRYGPWTDHDFFVSGSAAMVKATLRRLAELQIPMIRIKYDAFSDLA
ncbi:MAG: flavohemoprotein [Actinobacteria bacterium 13_2_20CM_2_71_6]|nr:MAG: flavohemoprotein [Actinobacteria bacterium 13_2_20CM_2_71_6]